MFAAKLDTKVLRSAIARAIVAVSLPIGMLIVAPVAAQQVIKYGIATYSMSHAPGMVGAVAPEIFAKHGIKLETTDFRGSSNNCLNAVISGAIDTCQVGTTTGTDAIAEGANIKVVALIVGPIGEMILSAKTVAKLGNVTANSNLNERVRALKGLRFTTSGPGTGNYVIVNTMLTNAGMSITDLRFRPLLDPVAIMESIRHDQIDGAFWTVGTLAGVLADKSGVGWINLAAGEVPEFRDVPNVAVYSQAAWVEKNPELANRLNAGLADAITAIKKEPAKYSKLLKEKYFPQLDPLLWSESYRQIAPSLIDGARASRAGWDFLLKLQAENTKKDYSKAAYEKALIPAAQVR